MTQTNYDPHSSRLLLGMILSDRMTLAERQELAREVREDVRSRDDLDAGGVATLLGLCSYLDQPEVNEEFIAGGVASVVDLHERGTPLSPELLRNAHDRAPWAADKLRAASMHRNTPFPMRAAMLMQADMLEDFAEKPLLRLV